MRVCSFVFYATALTLNNSHFIVNHNHTLEEEQLGTSALVREELIEDDNEDYEDQGEDNEEDHQIDDDDEEGDDDDYDEEAADEDEEDAPKSKKQKTK
jgi:hypothetical protein